MKRKLFGFVVVALCCSSLPLLWGFLMLLGWP